MNRYITKSLTKKRSDYFNTNIFIINNNSSNLIKSEILKNEYSIYKRLINGSKFGITFIVSYSEFYIKNIPFI
jgi:hypothetical protein